MVAWSKVVLCSLLGGRLTASEIVADPAQSGECAAAGGCAENEELVALQIDRRSSGGRQAVHDAADPTGCILWDSIGDELREPQVINADEPIELHVTTLKGCVVNQEGKVRTFYTRAYALPGQAPTIPGPTIRVKPGQTLDISVINDLTDKDCPPPPHSPPNVTCYVNTTNLHVHGLHVSAKKGGDDVLGLMIPPGKPGNMKVTLPENHAPGLNWYHPHYHGSTADQAGGGMLGAIYVEDPPGYLPDDVENMEKKTMVITFITLQEKGNHLDHPSSWFGSQPTMEENAHGNLWQDPDGEYVHENIKGSLINGMLCPSMSIESGVWYRLDIVFATVHRLLQLEPREVSGGFACEMQLLAKDGVYVSDAPRKVKKLFFSPGNRVSVAMRCTCKDRRGHPHTRGSCEGKFQSKTRTDASKGPWGLLQTGSVQGPGTSDIKANTTTLDTEVIRFKVKASFKNSKDLPAKLSLRKPCYLVDLTGVEPQAQGIISMPIVEFKVLWSHPKAPSNYSGSPWGHEKINQPLQTLKLGTVQELLFDGKDAFDPKATSQTSTGDYMGGVVWHPTHMHTTQFQVVSIACKATNATITTLGESCPDDLSGWIKVGDWQDTMMYNSVMVKVRFQLEKFPGHMVIHCHFLTHEDGGMMGYFNVAGCPGKLWDGAEKVDSTCYRGAFAP